MMTDEERAGPITVGGGTYVPDELQRIKVAGMWVDIVLPNRLIDDNCVGAYVPALGVIEITPRAPSTLRSQTLIHELLECINARCHMELDHDTLSALAVILHGVLKDNGRLFKCLIDGSLFGRYTG